jgi:hypothetical protein
MQYGISIWFVPGAVSRAEGEETVLKLSVPGYMSERDSQFKDSLNFSRGSA